MIKQKTIQNSIVLKGVGLHSGEIAHCVLEPLSENSGIWFERMDLPQVQRWKASPSAVYGTTLATRVGSKEVGISTVEHLLAAVQVLGIQNLLIRVDGPEIPVLDGSAWPFFEAISRQGLKEQNAALPIFQVQKRIEFREGEKWAVVEPSDRLEIHSSIEWDHPSIGFQNFTYIQGQTQPEDFLRARTFGFLKDVEALKERGFCKGGSLDNAVVLTDHGILNEEGLRYSNEFARHKVLDALGDLALAGTWILGKIILHRGGHDVHHKLVQKILESQVQNQVVAV